MISNILPYNNNPINIVPRISSLPCAIFKSANYLTLYLNKQRELEDAVRKIGLKEYTNCVKNLNLTGSICHQLLLPVNDPFLNVFLDLTEVSTNLYLYDKISRSAYCLHVSNNFNSLKDSINFVDSTNAGERTHITQTHETTFTHNFYKVDYCFIEITSSTVMNPQDYITQVFKSLVLIINQLNHGGLFILKMDYFFYKPVIELLYILSCMFEKVFITKPLTSNTLTFEKYIICKQFNSKMSSINTDWLSTSDDRYLSSLLSTEMPCYFLNRLVEIDVMLGQQLLESLQEIINTVTRDNKIDFGSSKHIGQKASTWCSKYKMQGTVLPEKQNVFLDM
tara:strand:+ start:293 stop:1303 length:1011 start_codon:yes stop_codon:yes gene_type:complete